MISAGAMEPLNQNCEECPPSGVNRVKDIETVTRNAIGGIKTQLPGMELLRVGPYYMVIFCMFIGKWDLDEYGTLS